MSERDDSRQPHRADRDLELLRIAGPRPVVARDVEFRVRKAVHAHWRASVDRRRRRVIWFAVAMAASVLLVLFGLQHQRRPAPAVAVGAVEVVAGEAYVATAAGEDAAVPGMRVFEGAIVGTNGDGRLALRLGDRSVRLDSSSRITVRSADRVLLENGAAYLDSNEPAADHGLTVVTPLADVLEIGTQFEVRLLDGRLRVRVREGSAVVQRGALVSTVAAGEEVSLGSDGALSVGRVASTDPGWAWVVAVAPPFRLEGSSVASFLRWTTRETGLILGWASPQLAAAAESIVLHGDATGFPPDQAAAAVLPTCGLTHRVVEGTLVVSRGDR